MTPFFSIDFYCLFVLYICTSIEMCGYCEED